MWNKLVVIIGAILLSGAASASTVTLVWSGASSVAVLGLGGSAVDVSGTVGPVTLTLDVILGADAAGISSGRLDLEFDADGYDELDLVSFSEFSWANSKATASLVQATPGIAHTQESQRFAPEGQAFGFEAFTLGQGPANVTIAFARLVFVTDATRAIGDAADVFSTAESGAGVGFFDNAGLPVSLVIGGASVHGSLPFPPWIPEPGTLALLGFGLLGIAAARRARTRED